MSTGAFYGAPQVLPGNGEPPNEFRIFPFGAFNTEEGRFVFTAEDGLRICEHWKQRGTQPVIEYEHASTRLPGQPTPAAGWFTIELRRDGLWATRIKWTKRAAEYIRAGEYRYTSPTFPHTDGKELGLFNVSLTNTPATHDQRPLVAASTRIPMEMTPEQKSAFFAMCDEFLKTMMAQAPAAGEPMADAAEDAAEVAVLADAPTEEAPMTDEPAMVEGEELVGDDSKIAAAAREACGLAADASVDEVLGALMALTESKKALGDSEQSVATLSARIGELEGAVESTKRDALIERAQKSGKLSGSLLAWAKGQSVATLSSFIDAAPGNMSRLTPVKPVPATTATDTVMSEAHARVQALFGK